MPQIHSLLDQKTQIKAIQYEKEKRQYNLINSLLSGGLIFIFWLYLASPLTRYLFPDQKLIQFFAYTWIFILFQMPLSLFFSWLSEFKHEHHYNFSNQTLGQWLWDQFKGFLISLLLMPLLLGILYALFTLYPESWWYIAAFAMIALSLIFATIFPILILPLFNKYTPIEDDELTNRLREVLTEYGISIKGFFLQDMSKQTKKENAFLAGMGKTRRVVLSDNIVNNMTLDELETVIAHEVGHYKHKHILKNIFILAFVQVVLFYALHRLMPLISPEFLSSATHNLIDLPLFLLLMSLLSTLFISPFSNALSRYYEKQADTIALEATQNPQAFKTAMAGLANRNLSNAYPTTWMKILYYSHPPVGERLDFADKWENNA